MMDNVQPGTRKHSTRFLLVFLLIFTVLTAAVTYPQAWRMRDGVNDIGDPLLNTWALAWVAHQLPFAPAHVFDGNIFHPERRTLAYSETLLAPAVMGAPLLWLGAGPVLVYNLLLFAAIVLSGVGTALLVRDLTGSGAAAVVAGSIFAFLPFRFDHYAHFQLLQTQWMPLSLWAFHRVLRDGRLRDGVTLGTAVGCQALSSMYNGLFLGSYLVVVGTIMLRPNWPSARARIRVSGGKVVCRLSMATNWTTTRARMWVLAVAVTVAVVLVMPAAVAHSRARQVVGERSKAEAMLHSATWVDFLIAPPTSLLYGEWSERMGHAERRLFPGFLAIALSVVALWPPWSRTRVAYAVGLLFAIDVTRGFHGWTYGFLYDYLYVFRGLRVPARMGIMVGLSLAVLSGLGVARLSSRVSSRVGRLSLAVVLLAVVILESWVAPLRLATIPAQAPETYADLLRDKGDPPRATIVRRLSDPSPAVVVEFPIGREDPTYMYYSIFHWQTLVNGYSGFFPPRYSVLIDQLKDFPSPGALGALASLQTRYVVIHGELLDPKEYQRLTAAVDALAADFTLVSRRPWQGREISLYRFAFRN